MAMVTVLEAKGLLYAYGGAALALDGLDLAVEKGRKLAIVGPNGAGKTTLLLHLNGTLKPSSGQVLVGGQPAAYSRDGLNQWRRRVGLVLQDADDQIFAASVAEDVSFGPLNLGLSEAEAKTRVAESLEALGIAALGPRPPHLLSFGQKKRVALAGALAMRPEILLLDEPTAGLDRAGADQLLAALAALHDAGTTLVFSTHDVDLAHAFADDAALFDQGRVVAAGPVAAVLGDRDLLARAKMRPPLTVEIGLLARERGLLGPDEPLPATAADVVDLLARAARR